MEVPMTLRPALMLSCALGALSLAGRVEAQAFNGDPTTIAGTVSYDRATPGVETITLDSPSAIIRWVPNVGGNPLIFLPSGRTATFVNGISNSNFAVLNRIQANVPIRFDGTVLSRLVDAGTGTSAPGGTVIFESPGGIIVGPKALFDVGNLILTTLTVATDGGGNFIDASGAFHFSGGAKAGVIVEPGGQILANTQGSYIGLIAPVIQQGGTVRVNGSVAYVAAEDVEFRVNAGLFDIVVGAGSQFPVPLVHTGATGGPASTGAGDVQRIYMVAVPKNTAITAILQGNVGFDPAVVAGVENGAIVLSAGYSVVGGEPDRFADFTAGPVPGLDASFEIRGGTISSDLFGYAVTNMLANGSATGSLAFDQDVSLFGGVWAALSAGPNQVVTVGGNAFVSAAHFRTIKLNPIDLVGGTAQIFADGGGSVDISGNAIVDASAQGVVNVVTSTAGHGTGGTAGLFADTGGSVRVRGNASVLATGVGGMLDLSPNRGGTGQGGVALVEGRNGGQVQLDGALAMDASGTGSRSNGSANPGAAGTGGDAHVAAIGGGTVTVAGATALTANGTGGEVTGGAIPGGTGQGGIVSLAAAGTVTFAGDPVLNANGFGAAGPTGGTAQGGTILLAATPVPGAPVGSVLTAGTVTGTASATGAAAAGNTPGEWHVTAGAGSLVDLANLTLTAAVNGPPATLPFSSLEALRGRINVTQTATLATPADIRVIGDGLGLITGGLLDIDAGGDVTVTHTSRGANFTIDVTDLDIDGANVTVAAGSATRASNRTDVAAGAAMTVGGVMDGREIVITSASADVLAGGSIGGATTELADIRATGNASVAGTMLGRNILVASNGLTVAGTGIVGGAATDQTELRATGNAAIAGRVLGGSILVTAADINVAQTGAVGDATTQLTDIRATGNASVAGTILGRNILLASNALTVTGTGIIGGGTTDQTELRTTGTSAISGRILGRSILVTAAAVNVAAPGAVGDASTQQADIRATGNAAIAGTVLGRTINIQGATLTVPVGGTIGGAGTDQARLTALGNAGIAGRVLGRDIQIASADIDLTGAVGDAGTQLATLTVNPTTSAATLGGAAQGPGYTLTNAEAGRIRADALTLNVPALAGGPALFVRDVTFNGGGAAAGIGTLAIVTPGIARVEGNLLLANARAADGISFTATQRLEVVTPAGSIRVRDAAAAPGGTMALASNNLWVASAAVIDRLRLNPNYAGRDADLLDNGGADVPRGYVEANAVALNSGGTLFVQNSGLGLGTFATGLDFGGVTAGPGGLIVRSTGPAPATVTAFGRRLNADGSFTTGYDFFFAVNFSPAPGNFTAGSTFNTCIIPTGQCAARPPANAIPGRDPTTGPTGGSDSVQLPPGAEGDDLVDTSFATEGLIEEPVTSGGESILWGRDCDRDDDGDCDEVQP
jgi:filamentous hemagglutinin family protein